MSRIIFHLAKPSDVQTFNDSGHYSAPSLAGEGFIHCANSDQLPGVIRRYYAQATTLVLLTIDADKLGTALVMENTVGGEELFPHVYSSIERDAVLDAEHLDAQKISAIALLNRYESKPTQ